MQSNAQYPLPLRVLILIDRIVIALLVIGLIIAIIFATSIINLTLLGFALVVTWPIAIPLALLATFLLIISVSLVSFLAWLYWFNSRYHALPLRLIGLKSIPAIPYIASQVAPAAEQLILRKAQLDQATKGLSETFTIGTESPASGYSLMYDDTFAAVSLDQPEQFSMGWTTLGDVNKSAMRPIWADTLRDTAVATAQFWPTIAKYGLPYNLLILEKVTTQERLSQIVNPIPPDVQAAFDPNSKPIFVIDMSFFSKFEPDKDNSRFTPATIVFLKRNPDRTFEPFHIQVSGANGAGMRDFIAADKGWLYALQAAKTSITVWGIWIGHVFHWHIVTAAMQMTMFQVLPEKHIVRQLFGLQSDFLIAFDQFLLLYWDIAPPTSVASSLDFLKLIDAHASTRQFFDDDPLDTLMRLGLSESDFTDPSQTQLVPWGEYPVARYLRQLWKVTETYVGAVVDANYANGSDVSADADLQKWIAACGKSSQGNISGLPTMDTTANLKHLLTSLIYRITAHGASRLNQAANPAVTFAANFPPCLQKAAIPDPATVFTPDPALPDPNRPTRNLLAFLPNTKTIGNYLSFLFQFVNSSPNVPFIPLDGIGADLPFVGPSATECNAALVQYRNDVLAFITLYATDSGVQGPPAQVHQWELSIET